MSGVTATLGEAEAVRLAAGRLQVELALDPLSIRVVRDGKVLIDGLRLAVRQGSGSERLIQITEGVIPEEAWEEPEPIVAARPDGAMDQVGGATLVGPVGAHTATIRASIPATARVLVEVECEPVPFRLEASWAALEGERVTGLGARHGLPFDQSGRRIRLGADRRYTGPDCPEDMLDEGGIPQGDYAPAPWLLSSAGWALWIETYGPGLDLDLRESSHAVSQRAAAGPLRLHFLCDPTPAARLRRYQRLTGMPQVLPEWAYGHWKSRDVYEHQRDVEEDWLGYREHALPLDAIVIDSPWETQYNTWRFNPASSRTRAG